MKRLTILAALIFMTSGTVYAQTAVSRPGSTLKTGPVRTAQPKPLGKTKTLTISKPSATTAKSRDSAGGSGLTRRSYLIHGYGPQNVTKR